MSRSEDHGTPSQVGDEELLHDRLICKQYKKIRLPSLTHGHHGYVKGNPDVLKYPLFHWRLAEALIVHANNSNIGPRVDKWHRALEKPFYAGVGGRRRRYDRYMLARGLVLMGVHPHTACYIARCYVVFDPDDSTKPMLMIDKRAKATKWAKDTTTQMLTEKWGRAQRFYFDVLDQEWVKGSPPASMLLENDYEW